MTCNRIHSLCFLGHFRSAVLLLDAGSNVNQGDHHLDTPLHHLLRNGLNNITSDDLSAFCDILLQYGANPTLSGLQDETPVMIANSFREKEILDMIYQSMGKFF